MTLQTYYRWALLLPLALPALAMTALLTEYRPMLLFWLGGSLVFAGVPYLLFAIGFLLWSRGRAAEELRRAVWMAPLVFALVLAGCGVVYVFATGGGGGQAWSGLQPLPGIGVVFGYAYVLLTEAVRLVLRPGRRADVAAG